MNKYWIKFKDHFNEILIGTLFFVVLIFIIIYSGEVFTKDNFSKYSISLVAFFAAFLTWLQFMFYKANKKKESALTYFPRPMELEELENSIDRIIGFWSRKEPLDNYEINLMTGEEINTQEYQLIWDKISILNKIDIIKRCKKKYKHYGGKKLKYKEMYNVFINELYRDARRKLNAYLNQIEGYCLAINKGNIDSNSAKDLFSYKFYEHFRKARPYIEKVRKDKNDEGLYIEFENVLSKWNP